MSVDQVVPRLYQGSRPKPGCINVDVLVLMAREYQPRGSQFPCTHVIHAPIDDSIVVSPEERWMIHATSKLVAGHIRQGRRVLVTCNMGWNRSGVVTALAIRKLYPTLPAQAAIELVRRARGPSALSNPGFVEIVEEAK